MNSTKARNQYFELGVRGRKTGWTSKPNLKRDSDGLANVDDFFDSEPEIQDFSAEEEEEENMPHDMIPASRRHRTNREERRQERFRHRGRPERERSQSEEVAEDCYEEENQNEHPTGFFEDDQVNGFLPTRPLARTPLAPRNISREPSFTEKSRSAVQERNDSYYEGEYEGSRQNDFYDDNDQRGAEDGYSLERNEDEYRRERPVSRAYSVSRDYDPPRSPKKDGYSLERDEDEYRRERPVSRAYSVSRDYDPPRSPKNRHDGYLSDHSKYELSRPRMQQHSRRGSQIYNRDGYQNSPRIQQGRIIHARALAYGGQISHSPRENRPRLQYPESSTAYEGQSYSSRVSRPKYSDYEGEYRYAGNPINRRKSFYAEEPGEYEPIHHPGSSRKLRKSLSYPELPRVRPLSRAELASHGITSRPDSRLSTKSPRRKPQMPAPIHQEYSGQNYDNDYGTPENRERSEASYEHEIARSLSMGRSRISSSRSQKVAVEDVQERFEGEDYNDFPAPIDDHYDYEHQPDVHETLPIEDKDNLPKSPVKAKRGRPKKIKGERKTYERKEPGEKPQKRPNKRTLYPQDFTIGDHNDDGEIDGVRKSKRVKIPPLAYWKNEKIVYGRRDSGYCPVPVMKEVIRVESDSDQKPTKRRSESKKETLTVEKADLPVINFITQEEEDQQIVVTPDMIDPRTVGAGDYRFQKVFSEGEFLASGVLYLPRGSQKPNKNSNASAMIFVVMAGQVQVQIHKTVFTVGTGAQFFVPRGNQYRISNSGYKEARLFFCHGKEVNASTD